MQHDLARHLQDTPELTVIMLTAAAGITDNTVQQLCDFAQQQQMLPVTNNMLKEVYRRYLPGVRFVGKGLWSPEHDQITLISHVLYNLQDCRENLV